VNDISVLRMHCLQTSSIRSSRHLHRLLVTSAKPKFHCTKNGQQTNQSQRSIPKSHLGSLGKPVFDGLILRLDKKLATFVWEGRGPFQRSII